MTSCQIPLTKTAMINDCLNLKCWDMRPRPPAFNLKYFRDAWMDKTFIFALEAKVKTNCWIIPVCIYCSIHLCCQMSTNASLPPEPVFSFTPLLPELGLKCSDYKFSFRPIFLYLQVSQNIRLLTRRVLVILCMRAEKQVALCLNGFWASFQGF